MGFASFEAIMMKAIKIQVSKLLFDKAVTPSVELSLNGKWCHRVCKVDKVVDDKEYMGGCHAALAASISDVEFEVANRAATTRTSKRRRVLDFWMGQMDDKARMVFQQSDKSLQVAMARAFPSAACARISSHFS